MIYPGKLAINPAASVYLYSKQQAKRDWKP